MGVRIGSAALVLALAAAMTFGGGGAGAQTPPRPLEFEGVCWDGSEPVDGQCCFDPTEYCRKRIRAIGYLPAGPSVSRTTSLSGAEQSETSAGDIDGTGFASIAVYTDRSTVCFAVTYSNIGLTQAGHIHLGARRANGPPVVNLYSSPGAKSPVRDCVVTDPVTVDGLVNRPRDYYVQLHNGEYPLGVVRGQLGD
jgi:hypothetical protein